MKHPYRFGMLAAIVAALAILVGLIVTQAAGDSADFFAVDLDTTGNTSATLGTIDECQQVSAGSDVTIDVAVSNVPAGDTAMIGFTYVLGYDASVISVTGYNSPNDPDSGLLSTAVGYSPFPVIDTVPDTDGLFAANILDTNAAGASGSGYLQRLTIHVDAGATAGGYALSLAGNSNYLDTQNAERRPDALFGARLAVGMTCAELPPPTAAPIQNVMGDVDCSGGAHPASAVDALKILRWVVSLPINQPDGCTPIGTGAPYTQGDVDCSGGAHPVSAIDALKILRHVVSLPVTQNPGCPPIGS